MTLKEKVLEIINRLGALPAEDFEYINQSYFRAYGVEIHDRYLKIGEFQSPPSVENEVMELFSNVKQLYDIDYKARVDVALDNVLSVIPSGV